MSEKALTTDVLTAARQYETSDPALINLLGALVDEIERLTAINRLRFSDDQAKEIERLRRALESSGLKRLQADIERDFAVEDVARLLNAITNYVRSKKNGHGAEAAWWWELQEIERLHAKAAAGDVGENHEG